MKQSNLLILFALSLSINYTSAQTLCEGWATGGGGINYQGFASVTTDAAGNIYAAGLFDTSAIFSSYVHSSLPYHDGLYLNKYDVNGQLLWSKMVAQGNNIFDLNSITSSDDALFLCGGGTNIKIAEDSSSSNLVYVIKTDFDGNIIQHQLFTNAGGLTTSFPYATYITLGPDSNLFFTGRISGNVSFGSVNLYSDYNTTFLAKLDQNLNTLWAIEAESQTSGSAFNRGNHISFLSDERIVLSGMYFEKFAFSNNSLGNTSGNNTGWKPYIGLFNTNGANVWVRGALGSSAFTSGYANSRDSQDNIYLAGNIEDTLTFGSITVIGGSSKIFIAKYNTAGAIQWVNAYGKIDSIGAQWTGALLTDPNDTVFLIGQIKDSSYLDNFLVYDGEEGNKVFIAKMNSNGDVLDVRYSKKGGAVTYDADFHPDQSLLIGGSFYGAEVILGDTYMANSSNDSLTGTGEIFVWKVCWNDTVCCDTLLTNIDVHTDARPESGLLLYPNPASDFLIVELPFESKMEINIINLLGQTIFYDKVNSSKKEINLHLLPDGMYEVMVTTPSGICNAKFLKQ